MIIIVKWTIILIGFLTLIKHFNKTAVEYSALVSFTEKVEVVTVAFLSIFIVILMLGVLFKLIS